MKQWLGQQIRRTGAAWAALLVFACVAVFAPQVSAYTLDNMPTAGNLFGTEAQKKEAEANQGYDANFFGQYVTGDDGVPVNRSLITMCDQEGITNRIVKCVANIATQTAVRYFDSVSLALHSYTLAMAILAVTFFGAQMLFGSITRPGPEAFGLLVKIAFVLFIGAVSEELVTRVIGIFETVEGIAKSFFDTTSGITGEMQCRNAASPFLIIDCILEQFTNSSGNTVYNGETFNDPAFMILLQVSATTSFYGFIVSIFLGIMLVFVLILAFRCTMLYIANILTMVILLTVAPIFTPMILFKATKDKFTTLVNKLLSTLVQPLILFVFVCFTFNVVDNLMFRHAEYSLSGILGVDWKTPETVPPPAGADLEALNKKIEDERYYKPDSPQYADLQQTNATEHTVTAIGDIQIDKKPLIQLELDVFEDMLKHLGDTGAAVGEVVDKFIEKGVNKVVEHLVPIKVYYLKMPQGRTVEELNQDLMEFALVLLFILPTFLYFAKSFPDLLRQLSKSTGKPLWNTPVDKAVQTTAKATVAAGKGAVTGAVKGMMKGGPKGALVQGAVGAAQGAGKAVSKSMGKG